MTWSFHVDDLKKYSWYEMIIGRDLLLELKFDLCFSNYMIKGGGGAYEGCIAPMKYPSDLRDDTSSRNEEWWKIKHVLDSTSRILDAKYQNANLRQIVSNSKYLNDNEQIMLRDLLTKYEFLFDGTLGTWKTKPVDIEIQLGAKPYYTKPYLVPGPQE